MSRAEAWVERIVGARRWLFLVLAVVTVGTVLWLAWFTAGMEVQQVLRAGEATK